MSFSCPLTLIFLLTVFSPHAQSLKIAHVNEEKLLKVMPETKIADSFLLSFKHELEDSNQKLLTQYQEFLPDPISDGGALTDSEMAIIELKLRTLQNKILNFQSSAQEILDKKKEELYRTVRTKAEKAIKEVAEENGYSYILDSSEKSIVYASDEFDITELVKTKLLMK
ncbi:MAG TPA: OmpH family outer membrane protein [Chitinophagales bacterium]|nr:OmpH family outer membrane protein [Chitinophagales bacterium]